MKSRLFHIAMLVFIVALVLAAPVSAGKPAGLTVGSQTYSYTQNADGTYSVTSLTFTNIAWSSRRVTHLSFGISASSSVGGQVWGPFAAVSATPNPYLSYTYAIPSPGTLLRDPVEGETCQFGPTVHTLDKNGRTLDVAWDLTGPFADKCLGQ